MPDQREAEHDRIKRLLQELEDVGLTPYKVALIIGQPYNTVKHWKATGRVESHYAERLTRIHRMNCPTSIGVCQIEPQHCEISHITK